MSLELRVSEVEARIAEAAKKSRRSADAVTLVAVTKLQPVDIIKEFCFLQSSKKSKIILGENYVQEFRDKKPLLPKCESHLIGPLQTNKAKLAVGLFDLIESVSSEKVLSALNKEAGKLLEKQKILLQVNVSNDSAKAGFAVGEITAEYIEKLSKQFSSISIEGLMTITQLYDEPELARRDFARLKELSLVFKPALNIANPVVSMGMSSDFEYAIEEGATHVRVGSAIFGERP